MREIKKARELSWDDTTKAVSLMSGSDLVVARTIVIRDQTVTVSDPNTGKVLTLYPDAYVYLEDPSTTPGENREEQNR